MCAIAKPTLPTAYDIFQLPQCCSFGSVTELSYPTLSCWYYQLTTTTNLFQNKRRLPIYATQISLCGSSIRKVEIKSSSTVIMDPSEAQHLLHHRERQCSLFQLDWIVSVTVYSTGRELAGMHPLPKSKDTAIQKIPTAKCWSILNMQIKTRNQRTSETKQKEPTAFLTQLMYKYKTTL